MPTRRLTVCVDDFGLHEGINQAALELANLGRVSAISCLVDGPAWSSGSCALKACTVDVEVGLHLNFTEDFGRNRVNVSLQKLIALAYARMLNRDALKQDVEKQIDQFESALGRAPDFIDGHQHVHQLPVIREVLLEALSRRYPLRKPWIRSSRSPARWAGLVHSHSIKFKSRLIDSLGASALSKLAAQQGFRQNRHLLGVYDFDTTEAHYLALLQAWLHSSFDGDVLMCHPSVAGPWNDPILEARYTEHQVLSSNGFSELLNSAGIKIEPLRSSKVIEYCHTR